MFKLIRPHLKVWHLALMFLVLLLSALFIYLTVQAQQQRMRENVVVYAQTIEKTVNWQALADILKTSHSAADVKQINPAYLSLVSAQLLNACKANKDCDSIDVINTANQAASYLINVPINADNKPANIGTPYGASAPINAIASINVDSVNSQQIKSVSAYVPITADGMQQYMLGVNVNKSRWNKLLFNASLMPIFFTLMLLSVLMGFIWHHFKQLVQNIHAFESSTVEMSNVDALTGLSNRLILDDRMAQAIKVAIRAKSMVAILFVDLDYFKDVNDNFGHGIGDQLLKKVADRLNTLMRAEDTIARVGGDEFVILLGNLKSEGQAVIVADKIIEKITQPFKAGTKTLKLGASVGIAMYPQHDTNMQVLIKYADAAMYFSKRQGGGRCAIYNSTMSKPFDKTVDKDFINTVAA
jgi:diguanylate cyclase (GGDEF)-like protein